jgi:hypothetical protein
MVIQSVSIPFLYRDKWSAYIALAYVQLSLLSTYMLMRVVPSEFWSKHPDRDRWVCVRQTHIDRRKAVVAFDQT